MNPFDTLPDNCFWRRSFSNGLPISEPKFSIKPKDKIMAAGSCFARRVTESLLARGCNIIINEDFDFTLPYHIADGWHFDRNQITHFIEECRKKYNYRIFTSRYDNIYNSVSINQLLQRSLGVFIPQNDIWTRQDGKFVDAFRPKINPDGYTTVKELLADREFHLNAVKEAFSELDIFIFTFGLTETWRSKKDGAVYPIAPGVVGGDFNTSDYELVNLTVKDIVTNFENFTRNLRQINPNSKIIITVSPTPMIATARSDWGVIEASFYAKSTLRAACEEIVQSLSNISYFPSYEIVMSGAFMGINCFETDGRTPTKEVIERVMNTFFGLYFKQKIEIKPKQLKDSGLLTVEEECDNILDII